MRGGLQIRLPACLYHVPALKSNVEVQLAGLCLLKQLAHNHDILAAAIQKAGGVKAIIHAMCAHEGHAEVQLEGGGIQKQLVCNSNSLATKFYSWGPKSEISQQCSLE
jgi:hypothetical protein